MTRPTDNDFASAETRPEIESIRDSVEIQRWNWLKAELVAYARSRSIGTACQTPDLMRRNVHWLETGDAIKRSSQKPTSRFDWRTEILSETTIISDSYRNTKNVRAFMKRHASERCKFSNEFMQWMKLNQGKTLKEAVGFWTELDRKKQETGYREQALPQNQYNQFTRALSRAKPGISAEEMRRIWAIKVKGPRPHTYQMGDEYR
ncbi:MAG: DUF6434 domain-containing protein [Phormidesmis sp.]